MYTNGVIAVREKALLGERLKRLCECNAEEAFRQIAEGGFGSGAEANSSRDYEALIAAEERAIDAFIREFAPSKAELCYLLYPRDFFNAEALVKAEYLHLNAEKMLAGEGTVPVAKIAAAVQSGELNGTSILEPVIREACAAFQDEEHAPTGVQIGTLFVRAQFEALKRVCAGNQTLKALLAARADMTNLLTAFRSKDAESAKKMYVTGGKLSENELSAVFADAEKTERAFERSVFLPFVRVCLEARRAALPYTKAEQMLANYEIDYFNRNRFELNAKETFLYYVLRRRAECEDVRILFVCLHAGMEEGEIRKRLRSLREGL